MANKNEINVRLVVNDDGTVTIKNFGKNTEDAMDRAKNSSEGFKASLKSLQSNWLAATAAITGAAITLKKAWDMAEQAAQFEQSQNAFRTMVASMEGDADRLYASLKEKSAGMIDDKSLTEAANRAMSLGIPIDKLGTLMEIARAKARDMGITTTQAFGDIATGIGRGSPMILDNLGLMLKVGAANDALASKLGKTADELTDKEKQMALLNATIEAGSEALGRYDMSVMTNKEKMEKMAATVKNIELLVGQGLIRAFAAGLSAMQALAAGALVVSAGFMKIGEAYAWMREKTSFGADSDMWRGVKESFGMDATAAMGAAGDLWGKAKENMSAAIATADELNKAMQRPINTQARAAEEARRAAEERLRQMEKVRTAAVKMAEDDKKILEKQLADAQTYYDSLQAMIEKNLEEERKGQQAIMALRQQRADLEKSTAEMIAELTGSDKNMSARERYESGRSALNQQYMDTFNMGGQDRFRALEEYKKSVLELQRQFKDGIPGTKDIFGNSDDIISAKTIASDALSDIERATQNQRNTLSQLNDEQLKHNDAVSRWGQIVQSEAQRAQSEMLNLKNIIDDISAKIDSMNKVITLQGEDRASSMIEDIADKINRLHELASKPLIIKTRYVSEGSSSSWWGGSTSSSGLNLDAALKLDPLKLTPYEKGTDYVPRTGPYMLHQGEAVLTADENKSGRGGVNINGDIIIHVPESAAATSPEDWRYITRQFILPELRKVNA